MTALIRRRRRRTTAAFVAGLLVAVALPITAIVGARTIANSSSSRDISDAGAKMVPATPAAFMATVDDSGLVTSITVFVLAPERDDGSRSGGTIISVPVGAQVLVGVDDVDEFVRVGDVYPTSGLEAFTQALESLLHVTFSVGEVLDHDETASYLSQLANVDVSYPVDLIDSTDEGEVVLLPAGPNVIDSFGVADILLASRAGSAESDRLPWIRTLWDAVATSVGPGRPSSISPPSDEPMDPMGPPDLRSFIAAVLSGPVTTYQFSYEAVVPDEDDENPLDLYQLDIGEIVLVFASVAPSSVIAINPSVSVQLDSAFDYATTKSAVTRLLFIGANVLMVRLVDEAPVPSTKVITAVRLSDQELAALSRMLGDIEVSDQDDRVEGIDVQIVLGQDFVDLLASAEGEDPDLGDLLDIADDGGAD